MAAVDTVRTKQDLKDRAGVTAEVQNDRDIIETMFDLAILRANTLDGLRALPQAELTQGKAVLLLGAASIGKHPGDVYIWDENSVIADDSESVLQLSDGGAGRLVRVVRPPVVVTVPKVSAVAADAEVVRFVAPITGKFLGLKGVLNAALATGDASFTSAITGVDNLSGGAMTATQAGSAAGDVDEITHAATANDNDVEEGEECTVTVGGASTAGTANLSALFVPRAPARPRDMSGAVFDGIATNVERGAGLTGAVDGKTGLCSLWVRVDGGDASELAIFVSSSRLRLRREANNKFRMLVKNTAGSQKMILDTAASHITSPTWKQLLMSWDVANGLGHFWVNDAVDQTLTQLTDEVLDYTDTDWALGSSNIPNLYFPGAILELYFSTEYLDISIEANRRKFISAAGKPVDLGADGSLPTGNIPLIYLANHDWRKFPLNAGSGGDFSVVGGALGKPFPLPTW